MILIFDYFETLLNSRSMDFNRGLKVFWETYYRDRCSFEEMKSRAVIATCQLAKRQMTWIRGWKEPYTVLNMGDPDNLGIMLREIRARGA